MIRLRRPALDNKSIIKLIREQLYPMTQQSFPALTFNKQEVYARLRKGVTYVVRIKMKTIGFVHLFAQGKSLWIDLIAMDPKQRGKGWGGKLLQKAEQVGKRKECDIAYLYVDKENKKGQQFYQQHGYKEVYYEPATIAYLYSKSI
jgi:ribosomal protein S18 acetylase RimI-like enzyme